MPENPDESGQKICFFLKKDPVGIKYRFFRKFSPLLAVRIVCPFLDDLLGGLSAAPVVVLGRCRPVLLGLFIVRVGFLLRNSLRCFLRRSLGLVAAGMESLASLVPAPVPPVVSSRSLGVLSLPGLAAGGLWLRLLFFHNVQTDKSGQEPQIVWHGLCGKSGYLPGNLIFPPGK